MMPTCTMNETKLEVSESCEEADLSDVEDEVFVRGGGRNGYRKSEYDTAKKPLMTPRKKVYGFDNYKNGGLHTEVRSTPPTLRVLCMPMCYILIATFAMLGLVAVITFLTSYVSWPLSILSLWQKVPIPGSVEEKFLPCDNIEVEDVWVRQFPKLLTESSFRLLDVNQDGVDDIIFGYATGADGYGVPEFVCDIYFGGQSPCFGGVLALDGKDGSELWRHWTAHEVFGVNCNEDLNADGTGDCLIGGRAGVFCALNGRDGSTLWTFGEGPAKNPIMNIYTSQFIRDLNNDGTLDVLAVHGGDPLAEPGSATRLAGRIIIISGKTGEVLQWVETPDRQESYYSPQVLTRQDGSDYVLFGTGGETHGGGLYIISMTDLYKGIIDNVKLLYKDELKGIMVPPVITDVNGDKIDDIVMAMFNSTVVAFDGNSFNQLWNYTFPSSESYTTPTPGYFNEDDIPDFLVKYQFGPGFPVYYHAQTTVLDGSSGKPILQNPIIDTIGSQASTPVIRLEGFGNDIFLYWSSNCKGFEGNSSQFSFSKGKGTNVHEQSRADLCKLRFSSKLINQLRAFTSSTGLPGIVIYDSEIRAKGEYNNTINTSEDAQTYLRMHPEMWQYFDQTQPMQQQQQQELYKNPILDPSEMIPLYPASGILPSIPGQQSISRDQYVPSYPGGAPMYDLPSQPELSEDVKYPQYHNVRKHGKYNIPQSILEAEVASGMSNGNGRDLSININRRTHHNAILGSSSSSDSTTNNNPILSTSTGNHGSSNTITSGTGRTTNPANIDPKVANIWGNYYKGAGGGVAEDVLSKYPNVLLNDQYEKSGRGRYRYVAPRRDNIEQVSGVNNAALENEGGRYEDRAEEIGNDDLDNSLPYSHRWKRALESSGGVGRDDDYPRGGWESKRQPVKRHIGAHDLDGIQRLISTGTLVKPLNRNVNFSVVNGGGEDQGGIDVVFATYWFFPAKTQAILPKDRECIQEKMSQEKQRFDERSKYYGMEHDQYEDAVTNECVQSLEDQLSPDDSPNNPQNPSLSSSGSGRRPDGGKSSTGGGRVYESQSSYNPFDIHMGQMTVYRLHISCSCSEYIKNSISSPSDKKGTGDAMKKSQETGRKCAKMLPMKDQPWSGYMGSHADSYFQKRPRPTTPPVAPTFSQSFSPLSPSTNTNPQNPPL